MTLIRLSVLALVFTFVLCPARADVAFQKNDGNLVITVDGKLFAVYVWNDPTITRPYFKQVNAAGGEVQITRNHPQLPGDFDDHATFHPGIWWAFGDVGGNDYWRLKARVVGGDFVDEPVGGKDVGSFSVRDKLLSAGSDEVFCEQICRYSIHQRPSGILLVCEGTLVREKGDFWLGDQEEMGLAARLATPIASASHQGGRILNSDRSADLKQIRTRQSDWCDYSGPVAGRFGGLMMMNDPGNFRKPWWHAVDTGLLVANPLGESELNGRGKRKENVLVKAGQPFRLRYGVLIHLNDKAEAFDPSAAYADFLSVVKTLDEQRTAKKISKADLPRVPEGFQVSIFAQEPLVYKPTALCFDAKGRLFVGQGPQYPENYQDSPTDSVFVLVDSDHDGVADRAQEFAKGFNSVQGLAWHGNDLYVANSPELTVVRDLDGDDQADEYVMVYTDLGNREHALHGLNFGPDGKLYMSKGNSKGHNQPEKTGYVAPRPFRELWDVAHPPGAPDSYPPKVFTRDTYKKTYHHWDDDWGREGGVLRCDPMGAKLEIVSRGLRNPWDITMDAGFNWLGTDNDQSQGDRLMMPFFGAHFGWGHPYSSHWSGDHNLPTAPVSGPMFPGSGTGIIYYDHDQFPAKFRQVFFINDWLDGTFIYRPTWDGALMQPLGGALEPFAQRGGERMLYRPTDMEFGPDGSIIICGWGGNYHYDRDSEGSWLFRINYAGSTSNQSWQPEEKRSRWIADWTLDQLLADLGPASLPVWRVGAQDELVRRGAAVRDALIAAIDSNNLSTGQQTWAAWAVGRMLPGDAKVEEFLIRSAGSIGRNSLNLRLQALRMLAYRVREGKSQNLPNTVGAAIADAEPRVRFEAVQALHQAGAKELLPALLTRLADEDDRLVYYAGWGALRRIAAPEQRKQLLADQRPRVRLAALLSLQEDYLITMDEALAVAEKDSDADVQSWALAFVMNPTPPTKMPNTTARVELEQSIPAKQLIERADKAVDRPALRHMYLTLMSRATFRGKDLQQIAAFYETLHADEERSLVLPALTTSIDSRELVWNAFGGESSLQRAGVESWHRMVNLSARALPSSEEKLRTEQSEGPVQIKSFTNVEANADYLASWLLEKMAECGPKDKGIECAAEVLADSKLSTVWRLPPGSDATLAAAIEQQRDTLVRGRMLTFLQKIDPHQIPNQSRLREVLKELCAKPDPRHYLALVNLTKRLQMNVVIPSIEVATPQGVLARLAKADPERGRRLFFEATDGAGCAACHRVAGRGDDFAPDLSGIGLRAKPETIVEAMLTPSAAITEGYGQQLLLTEDGRTLAGVVLRETAAELTVFQSDRTKLNIAVKSIVERRKLNQSIMPDGYQLFGNEQVADLTAFLLTLKHNAQDGADTQPH